MVNSVSELMSRPTQTVRPSTTLREAAELMRDADVGDVVVAEEGRLRGILTDRDIVVRCVASGDDPGDVRVESVCSAQVATVPPQSSVRDAVDVMRSGAVRRLPVVDDDAVIGVVTMGDLARAVDEDSALAEVTGAEPNR